MNARRVMLPRALACLVASTLGLLAHPSSSVLQETARERVAEGEFVHRGSEVPVSDAWILWREPSGDFTLESRISVIGNSGELELEAVTRSEFDADLRLQRFVSVGASPAPDGANVARDCRLEPGRFSCALGTAPDLDVDTLVIDREVSAAVHDPYEILGIDAWHLSRLALLVPVQEDETAEFTLVNFTNAAVDAGGLFERSARVRFVGHEEVDVLGDTLPAHRYEVELQIEGMTLFHVWLADDGIPLRAELAPRGDDPFSLYRIELRSFQRHSTR